MLLATAAAELERTALAYRQAATVLRGVPERVGTYMGELEHAHQVNWHSSAGDAFRRLVEVLYQPGVLLQTEAEQLAGTADTIASDLSSYAATARQLSTVVAAVSAVDLSAVAQDLGAERLESMRRAAADAVGDAASFIRYVDDNGGIPWMLQEAANRLW